MGELELLDKNEKQLRAKFPIRKIGIFGSVARGTASSSSDIDILVEFEHPVAIFEFLISRSTWSGCWADRWTW